ncbi:hypothetical protein CTAYLR_005210 [Chrysophaeum taylorii]|uniref:RGS domain-containing protein n=1 Tax=Chrysophaeum taylorii TaxID=2483200 RepID=A0AAD7XJD3_9STRA|nr:hypothetical protein CTAYLR_005210 [Chrysophaeum taylorii]
MDETRSAAQHAEAVEEEKVGYVSDNSDPSLESRCSDLAQLRRLSQRQLLDDMADIAIGGLTVDKFLRLFRIERETLAPSTTDKIRNIIMRLEVRYYDPGAVVLQQGDPSAPNELLMFVEGELNAHTSAKTTSSRTSKSADPLEDLPARAIGDEEVLLAAPFFIGEERVLKGSWPTATYRAGEMRCKCFVMNEAHVTSLTMTGGFDLDRTLRLRAFERTLAKHGMHVSILRDTIFVDHFMGYLVRQYSAENLRFLVDLMQFKREVGPKDSFETVRARFVVIWDAYMRPWGNMSNVCALECPSEVLDQARGTKEQACATKSSKRLAAVLDPIAKRVKKFIEINLLPAFVKSRNYLTFLSERFPFVEKGKESMTWAVGAKVMKKQFKETGGQSAQTPPYPVDVRVNQRAAIPRISTPLVFARQRTSHSMLPLSEIQSVPLFAANNKTSTTIPSIRPVLMAKLAGMAEELNEIDRNFQASGDPLLDAARWGN